MDKGLDSFLDNSQLKSSQKLENNGLEKKVYSKKYIALNYFLRNIDAKIKSNLKIQDKVKNYLRVGVIAKRGLEKASEIYTNQLEPSEELFFSLEKGQTPTLLHRYTENLKKYNITLFKGLLKDFEYEIKGVAFKYLGQRKRKRKLNHSKSLDYVLKNCRMKEIKNKNDVIEALMLAQEMGMSKIIISRWNYKKADNNKIGNVILALFERYNAGNKLELYNRFKDKLSKKFGRTMSKSTFYRYVRENKKSIKLIPETDILEVQSNVS